MTDRNEERNKETNEPLQNEKEGALQGRLADTANPNFQQEEKEPDISQIDRQEGTMNNGELGGNFGGAPKEDS
jgi:hypothetical protein